MGACALAACECRTRALLCPEVAVEYSRASLQESIYIPHNRRHLPEHFAGHFFNIVIILMHAILAEFILAATIVFGRLGESCFFLSKLSNTFFCAMLGAVCANSLRTYFFSATVKGMVPALSILGPRFGQHGLGTEDTVLLISAGREMSTVHHTLDRAPPPLLPVHRKPVLLI